MAWHWTRPTSWAGDLDLNLGSSPQSAGLQRGCGLPCLGGGLGEGGRGQDSAPTLLPVPRNLHLVREAARVTSEPRLPLSHSLLPSPAALWGMGAEAAAFPRPGEGQRLWAGHGLPGPRSPALGVWAGGEAWAGGRGSR